MAGNNVASDLITFALGGGLAALIGAGLKAWVSVRSGIKAGERETIDNIIADRQRARDEAEDARRDSRFWERVTRRYQLQLIKAGQTPDPENPIPPSEQEHDGT